MRSQLNKVLITSIALFVVLVFLAPLGYMFTSAIKSETQMGDSSAPPFWPSSPATFTYKGQELDLFTVPLPDGTTKSLAAVKKIRTETTFVDPADLQRGEFLWKGNWRTLTPSYKSDPQWGNFVQAWTQLNFPLLFTNSMIIAGFGTIGAVTSSILVAYGFSRFKFRGKKVLFMVLIGTIIIPVQATLIPTYILYSKIGWTNTFLPLIVPHFFANAYNVFLLRQYFDQIPRELDEAAAIDGASPWRVLTSIIVPQSIPAITAVSLFHFFFAWNDFFTPLIYLISKPGKK